MGWYGLADCRVCSDSPSIMKQGKHVCGFREALAGAHANTKWRTGPGLGWQRLAALRLSSGEEPYRSDAAGHTCRPIHHHTLWRGQFSGRATLGGPAGYIRQSNTPRARGARPPPAQALFRIRGRPGANRRARGNRKACRSRAIFSTLKAPASCARPRLLNKARPAHAELSVHLDQIHRKNLFQDQQRGV
jgi:hypothetical protein